MQTSSKNKLRGQCNLEKKIYLNSKILKFLTLRYKSETTGFFPSYNSIQTTIADGSVNNIITNQTVLLKVIQDELKGLS